MAQGHRNHASSIQKSHQPTLAGSIDLHVVEPSGDEIYSANKGPSATGGQLDLGPESDCSIDGLHRENIYWPTGRAARGDYTVRVDYRSACGRSLPFDKTQYVVTVNVTGQQPRVSTVRLSQLTLAEVALAPVGRSRRSPTELRAK